MNLTISGTKSFELRLDATLDKIDDVFLVIAERIYKRSLDSATEHWEEGALAASLGRGVRKIKGGYSIVSSNKRAKHNIFVHFGTKPHTITPKNKKSLRWPSGNDFVSAKKVNHPGYKGDPFMYRAADIEMSNFDKVFAEVMRDA